MKAILHIVVFLVGFCVFNISKAKQRVQFSQYMVNQYILNPAVGGADDDLDLVVGYRKQWVNFKGAPTSYYFSGNAPLKVKHKPGLSKPVAFHSIGGILFKDQTGPISKTTAMGSYCYNLPLKHDLRLSTGVFLGVTDVGLDMTEVKFDQAGESFSQVSKKVTDGSFGLWLYNHQFYSGFSVNQLFNNKIDFLNVNGATRGLVYHYYFTTGYKIPLGLGHSAEAINYLVPSVMLKYGGKGTSPSVDLNMKFHFLRNFWLGTSYRHMDSFILLGGVRMTTNGVGVFDLAYSYDYTLSKINSYTSGSHEITLKYSMNVRPIDCPKAFW